MVGTNNQVSSLLAFPLRVLQSVLTLTNVFTSVSYKGIWLHVPLPLERGDSMC